MLVVVIHQSIMKTMKVVQHTNNYSKSINETRLKLLHFLQLLQNCYIFFYSIKNPSKNNMGFSSVERFCYITEKTVDFFQCLLKLAMEYIKREYIKTPVLECQFIFQNH